MIPDGIDLAYVAEQEAAFERYLAACEVKHHAEAIAYVVRVMTISGVTLDEVRAAMPAPLLSAAVAGSASSAGVVQRGLSA